MTKRKLNKTPSLPANPALATTSFQDFLLFPSLYLPCPPPAFLLSPKHPYPYISSAQRISRQYLFSLDNFFYRLLLTRCSAGGSYKLVFRSLQRLFSRCLAHCFTCLLFSPPFVSDAILISNFTKIILPLERFKRPMHEIACLLYLSLPIQAAYFSENIVLENNRRSYGNNILNLYLFE